MQLNTASFDTQFIQQLSKYISSKLHDDQLDELCD